MMPGESGEAKPENAVNSPAAPSHGETPESGSDPHIQASSAGFASVERAFLRLTFWQTLLSLAGVFTGAVALYAALGESQAVRQQTAATVWPYVQVTINNHLSEEAANFSLEISNVGVGPARMRGMTVRLDGEAQSDWDAVLSTLLGESAAAGLSYGRSSVGRRVLAPQDSVTLFHSTERAAVQALQAAAFGGGTEIFAGELSLGYCYCSIFDACWEVEIQPQGPPEPVPVEECPSYADSAFSH